MRSGFTTIFTMIILMIIGAALLPFVDIGSQPRERQGSTLHIEFQWPNASAKVVEQNVTSRIEGVVSAVKGIAEISSESRYGSGRITIELKPEANPSTAKFEIASLIKQIRKGFPKEVSYPVLTGGDVVSGQKKEDDVTLLLTYHVHSDMSPTQLEEWVKSHIEPSLMVNEDIKRLEIYGGRSRYLDIQYDPEVLKSVGVSAYEIEDGIKSFIGRQDIIGDVVYENRRGKHRISLLLTTEAFGKPLSEMPIKTIRDGEDEKIVYLNDLATYEMKDRLPNYYYRVNGLETVYMNIYVSARANMISLSSMLREYMDGIIPNLPNSISMELSYDGAEKEQGQLYRLVTRSIISLLILLLFVWLVSRSWKYLSIITITLVADILISVLAYYIFDIRLHIFSLAGITVSLGLVIDSSIVMVDHYSYYKDKQAFLSIFAALLTTIGSLILIYFMPDYIQRDLYDFAWIVIINLCTALIVALWFVPVLVDKFKYSKRKQKPSTRNLRRVMRFNSLYGYYIRFTQQRKWIYYTILALAFGVPLYLLPNKVGDNDIYSSEKKELTWYEELYNSTLGNRTFVNKVKEPLSKWIGGSMRLFSSSLSYNTYAREDQEMQLYIQARMPQGGTAAELNDKVKILEEHLKTDKNIRRWETQVGTLGANIVVSFTPEALGTSAPYGVESRVIGKVIGIGGADWSTSGVSNLGFSNSLWLQYRSNRIELSGYNYERLYLLAEVIEKKLSANSRVVDVIIETPGYENQENEYYVEYDMERIASLGVDVRRLHNAIREMVSYQNIGWFDDGQLRTEMQLTSSQIDKYDLWKLNNSFVRVDDRSIMLGDVLTVKKREAKNVIPRKNQEYMLRVAYNVLGSYSYSNKLQEKILDELNQSMPVGYRCVISNSNYYRDTGEQYWLLLVVVAIVFFICAILFESIRRPLVIILLIPASFIGTFMTFYLSNVPFGTGGFASMVLLCGLVVNAGIYILSEFDNIKERRPSLALVKTYVKAYNHKIVPVFLTILSTVLGLVPFIWDGSEDQFWYSFAVGTIGGLLCSIVAIIIFLPIFVKLNLNKK